MDKKLLQGSTWRCCFPWQRLTSWLWLQVAPQRQDGGQIQNSFQNYAHAPSLSCKEQDSRLKKNWTACSRMKIFAAADGRLGTAVAACRCLGPGISIHLNYMCAKTTNWQGAVWVSPKAPAYWVGFCHGTQCREAVTWETVLLACIFCSWLVFKNFTKCVMALEMFQF